jgi:uncharacterized cupin superfamily protein
MTTTHTVAFGTIEPDHYEPFSGFDAVLEGDPAAGVAWLRTASAGEGALYAGMFVVAPSRFRYTFAGDETFHVLDGAVEIEVDGGPVVGVRAGDIVSFPKGARSTWTVTAPLRKFFVISG